MKPCHKNVEFTDITRHEERLLQTVHHNDFFLSGPSSGDNMRLYITNQEGQIVSCIAFSTTASGRPNGCNYAISREVLAQLVAYDYAKMREQMKPIRDALLRHVMHPTRLAKAAALQLF